MKKVEKKISGYCLVSPLVNVSIHISRGLNIAINRGPTGAQRGKIYWGITNIFYIAL